MRREEPLLREVKGGGGGLMTLSPTFALFVLAAAACVTAGDRHETSRNPTLTVLHSGDEREVFAPLRYPAQFLIFASLVQHDENGEIIPALAKGWQHSPDYREWTFNLRTDVRWHDGVPLTARDVRFTKELFPK